MAKGAKKEVSLEAIVAAGKVARNHPIHPWSTDQLRERLAAAGATWNLAGLADCPVKNRKALVSDYDHHPSWWKAKISFCAALPVRDNLTYTELATACEALGWPRPSHIDDAGRRALFLLLDDREGALWTQIRTLREPEAEPVAQTAPGAASDPAAMPAGTLWHQERPNGDLHAWHRQHPAVDDVWDFGPASGWRWKVILWQAVTDRDGDRISEEGKLRILAIGPQEKSYETWMTRDGFARSLMCAHMTAPVEIRSDVKGAFEGCVGLDFTGKTGVLFGEHTKLEDAG